MPLPNYEETLKRFGLERLQSGIVDLTLDEKGNIAQGRDQSLKVGDTKTNALFVFVESWRQIDSTVSTLFESIRTASKQLHDLETARQCGNGVSISIDPRAYHAETDSILECQSICSVLAGSIFVVLSNLLLRLRGDLGINKKSDTWKKSGTIIKNHSFGEIIEASANNFRHCDEWACAKTPTDQQRSSMEVLCNVLDLPLEGKDSYPTIRKNVCDKILSRISDDSVDELYQRMFDFAKKLTQ